MLYIHIYNYIYVVYIVLSLIDEEVEVLTSS